MRPPRSLNTASGHAVVCQRTLRQAIEARGIGLHSGARVRLTLKPAAPDSGILFRRVDMPAGRGDITASWRQVSSTRLCTTIANQHGASVATIEHLMSALSGAGIDNAVIEIDGPEVPAMDGSAAPFLFLIDCAGTVEQPAARRVIRILKPVRVGDAGGSAALEPAAVPEVAFEIDFAAGAIARQEIAVSLVNGTFREAIGPARTFGFAHEVEAMRAAGLARGGSLENAVVVDGNRVLNPEGLRFDDEFVRHKVLDCIGDLYLAGAPVIGRYVGRRAGHAYTHRLLTALFADAASWRYETLAAPFAHATGTRAEAERDDMEYPALAATA